MALGKRIYGAVHGGVAEPLVGSDPLTQPDDPRVSVDNAKPAFFRPRDQETAIICSEVQRRVKLMPVRSAATVIPVMIGPMLPSRLGSLLSLPFFRRIRLVGARLNRLNRTIDLMGLVRTTFRRLWLRGVRDLIRPGIRCLPAPSSTTPRCLLALETGCLFRGSIRPGRLGGLICLNALRLSVFRTPLLAAAPFLPVPFCLAVFAPASNTGGGSLSLFDASGFSWNGGRLRSFRRSRGSS